MKNLYNPFNLVNIYNNNYNIFPNDSSSNSDNIVIINNTSSISTNINSINNILSSSSNTTYDNIFSNMNDNTSISRKSIKSVKNNNINFNERCGYDNLLLVEWCSYFTDSVNNSYFSNNNDSHVSLDNSIDYLNDSIKFL